ncbi:MAG: N-acetyl-gamma-glutamyl-phosphate reductase [Treponema sp.]|jgi:N-acetyl-gamma-glutamyl-phosphate reductase|nr:N-acetyl-gamma-glutamyl-phosphate reductase [Treponema sp.]
MLKNVLLVQATKLLFCHAIPLFSLSSLIDDLSLKVHNSPMVAGVIGATGYAGAELVRLLSGHPKVDKLALSSVSFEGEQIQDIYPNFLGRVKGSLLKAEEVIAASDVVFSALPHAVGEPFAAACSERKIHYVDLSADFRFDDDEDVYSAWYGKNYQFPELHKKSIYGLPELNRQKIKELSAAGSVIIGNPGCYPTGGSLGAFPALAKGLYGEGAIIIDAASGVSGGGREPSRSFHYPECADSLAPYKVASHRHSPEIARNLSAMTAKGGAVPQLIFTPHLAPMNRGILSTIYIPLSEQWRITRDNNVMPPSKEIEAKAGEIREIYADFYKDEPFVRVLPQGVIAATNRVRQSNYCDISVHLDINGSTLIVATAIDNMVKGAAGQAIQNMNILFGFDEKSGLSAIPMLF